MVIAGDGTGSPNHCWRSSFWNRHGQVQGPPQACSRPAQGFGVARGNGSLL